MGQRSAETIGRKLSLYSPGLMTQRTVQTAVSDTGDICRQQKAQYQMQTLSPLCRPALAGSSLRHSSILSMGGSNQTAMCGVERYWCADGHTYPLCQSHVEHNAVQYQNQRVNLACCMMSLLGIHFFPCLMFSVYGHQHNCSTGCRLMEKLQVGAEGNRSP